MLRRPLQLWMLLLVFGCSMCDHDEPASGSPQPEEEAPTTVPPELVEPDPCPDAEAELAAFGASSPIALDALPTGRGGEPIPEDAPRLVVGDDVRLGDQVLGTEIDAAAEALSEAELPETDAPVALFLRASDPISRAAPLMKALPEGRQMALVMIETHHANRECRFARQIPFGLRQGDEHGWIVVPVSRSVSDLLAALGGADVPRRLQLAE